MELLATFLDIMLRLDVHLGALISAYGAWVYLILFLVIFAETGLIVTPFLPGDSLLFVAGALAALGGLNVHLLVACLIAAAILGDGVNCGVGRWLGRWILEPGRFRWVRREHFDRAHAFYEKHGGAAIIIARFLPIFRTYVPFVAGLAQMRYPKFTFFNVAGGILWVTSLTYAGYFFGNLPWVRKNLTLIIIGIIVVSLIPVVVAAWKARREA